MLRTVQLSEQTRRADLGETHLFVGERYVVTVRHGSQLSHVGLRGRCEAVPKLLGHGPAFVLYALMDFVVDQYFPIVDALEEELEALEQDIFSEQFDRQTMQRIYRLKRDLLSMKRAVAPLIEMCNRLIRFDLDLIPDATRPYFRDVYDHVVRINEMIDSLSQLVTTALEANLSLMSASQNEDTKRLAAWAAIIAVPDDARRPVWHELHATCPSWGGGTATRWRWASWAWPAARSTTPSSARGGSKNSARCVAASAGAC